MGGLLRVLLVLGFVVKFWWLILPVLVVAAAGFGLWGVVTRQDAELEGQHRAAPRAARSLPAPTSSTHGYSPATTAACTGNTRQ
jgi:hypothetical protein